ncbi:MAG: PQQ-binding-like beta-propeller repeat protein [Armatimonadetes bacterium]|nr:PQQ-binding-like beta-propeller repeat protein [Armatimonadota bacterium]
MRLRPLLPCCRLWLPFLIALALTTPGRAATAGVLVYFDTNANGLHDPGEMGAPDVLVTDGDRVYASDADGRARFETFTGDGEVHAVSVVVPGAHRATTPWHRLLDPRIEDEQPFLFGLQPLAARPDPIFAVTADLDVTVDDAPAVGAQLAAELSPAQAPPSFVTVLGDLTAQGSVAEMSALRHALERCAAPFYPVFGAHDGGPGDQPSTAAFEQILAPAWYAFWSGARCFLVLTTEPGVLTGQQEARQLRWLRRILLQIPAGSEVVTLSHIPPAEPELNLVRARHRLRAVFYGRWRENSVWWLEQVPMICTGPYRGSDWGQDTGCFRRVVLTADLVVAPVFTAGQRQRLEILAPSALQPPDRTRLSLRVLAADSRSDVVDVEAAVDGGAPEPLRRVGGETWRLDLPALAARTLRVKAFGRSGEAWQKDIAVPAARAAPAVALTGPPPRPPLVRAWLASTGARMSTTAAVTPAGDRLLLGLPGDDLPGNPGVVCLDARTGEQIWWKPTTGSVRRDVVVAGERAFALTHLNVVHAFALIDGRELWRRELTPEPPGRHRNSRTGLAVWRDQVLAQVGGGPLLALNAATGETLAKRAVGGAYETVPQVDGDRVVLATTWAFLAAVLPGLEDAWRADVLGFPHHSPVVSDGRNAYVVGPELLSVSLADGLVRWRKPLPFTGQNLGAVALADGVVYTPGARPAAYYANGDPLWPGIEPPRGFAAATPALTPAHVWTATDDGRLLAFDRATGAPVWETSLGVSVKSSPRIQGGVLYLVDAAGNVHCFVSAEAAP